MIKRLGFGGRVDAQREFDALLEEHLDGLFGAALRYTRDRQMAEDLVHDTVVKALRFRDSFELGTNFRAWIFTILTRTFIHRYRRRRREREILSGSTQHDVRRNLHSDTSRAKAAAPEDTLMEGLLSDDVLAALDSLSDDFRTVVVLCDVEGLSYKDIAEAVDVPVGTVMSRLYRGRRQLRAKLAGLGRARGLGAAAGGSYA